VNNLPRAVTRIKAEQQAAKSAAMSRRSNALTTAQLQCVYGRRHTHAVSMGVNATGTLGGRRSSAEDARIEAP